MATVADELRRLRARRPVLIQAAERGVIATLECAMEECRCPHGRSYFELRGETWNGPWGPSADRYPIPGRDGGRYTIDNVRLAHVFCNRLDGGRVGGTIRAARMTQEERSRAGKIGITRMSREDRAKGGHNRAKEHSVRAGRIGMCARWNIARGKPCTCGAH